MITLDKDRTLELLHQAVAERGEDYVYPRKERGDKCVYVHDGQPDCIVGEVLFHAGVSIEDIQRLGDLYPNSWDGGPSVQSASQLLAHLRVEGKLLYDEQAANLLAAAQSVQDDESGYPWGYAVEVAERVDGDDFCCTDCLKQQDESFI